MMQELRHQEEAVSGLHILAFDDEPATLTDTFEILASQGARVSKARNLADFSYFLAQHSGRPINDPVFDPYWEGVADVGTNIDIILLDVFLPDVSDLSDLDQPQLRVRSEEAGYYIWKDCLHAPHSVFAHVPIILTSEYAFLDEHAPEVEQARKQKGLPVWIQKKSAQDKKTVLSLLQEIEGWLSGEVAIKAVRQKILNNVIETLGLTFAEAGCMLGLGPHRSEVIRAYCQQGRDPELEDFNHRIDVLFDMTQMLEALFDGNWQQIRAWLNTENEQLEGSSPIAKLIGGKTQDWAMVSNVLDLL